MAIGDSFQAIAEFVAGALSQMTGRLATQEGALAYLETLGWSDVPLVPSALSDLELSLQGIADARATLIDKRLALSQGGADEDAVLGALASLVAQFGLLLNDIERLGASFHDELPSEYVQATGIDAKIQKRLVDGLFADYLDANLPFFAALLVLLGILEEDELDPEPLTHQSAFVHRELNWGRLGTLLQGLGPVFADVYKWGTPTLDDERLFAALQRLSIQLLWPVDVVYPSPAFLQAVKPDGVVSPDDGPPPMLLLPLAVSQSAVLQLGVLAAPKATSSEPQGLAFRLTGTGSFSQEIPLGYGLSVEVHADIDLASGVGALLRPGGGLSIVRSPETTPVAFAGGQLTGRFAWRRQEGSESLRLLTVPGGAFVEADEVYFLTGVDARQAPSDIFVELGIKGGRFGRSTSDSDGFTKKVSPSGGVKAGFEVGLRWSQQHGILLTGTGGLSLSIPLQTTIGPFTISMLRLALTAGDPVVVTAGIVGSVKLGPITATVDALGIEADLGLHSGNLGPVDLQLGLATPNGYGIDIDAGPVTGGGFLFFDKKAGRYAGAVELSVYSVAVKAFGIIDTKFPDGHEGFSFIIIISAEFTPIQLGFGFTLLGVGGMVGINRTLNADALTSIIRSHGLDNVLFPKDPVGDAPAIIADLASIFPPAEGHYVFGPMAKLGWGTPTLIDAEIGVVLVLPGPVLAVLGQVHSVLPNLELALVELNFAVAGVLDFPQKRFSLDASLHDSHIGTFPISGDMAMRINWGGDPNFALSVGGFHPSFKPPVGFPSLARVSVDLGRNGNPSLVLSGYMALTSNTAQIGARAELNASGGGLRLHGFIGFDALFVFSPFSFIASFDAGVSVTFHGHGIGLHAHGQVSGPSPWRVAGEVCVSILFWDACLNFSKSFGGSAQATLPSLDPFLGSPQDQPLESQQVAGLKNALQDPRNWSSVAPPGSFTAVALAQAPEGAPALIDPMGAASLHQRVVPLNRPITLFAGAKPLGPGNYTIQSVTLTGGITTSTSTVQDNFAPAAFQKMSDAKKLSNPSFEKMDAGVKVSTDSVTLGAVVPRDIVYNTIVIDPRTSTPPAAPDYTLTSRHLDGMTARSAAALAGLRVSGSERFVDPTAPIKVLLDDILYVVALTSNLAAATGFTTSTSKSALSLAVEAAVQATASLASQLQVIPTHEVV